MSARATGTASFFVVLDGKVAVVQETTAEPRLIAVHGPGRFLGDLALLTRQTVFVTALAVTDTDVLDVCVERLKDLLAAYQAMGDLILRAFILCRTLQANIGAGLRIIGSKYDPDARRLRDFASRNRIPHLWVDLDEDAQAGDLLRALGMPRSRHLSSERVSGFCRTRATPSWPSSSGCERRRPGRPTISWWSAQARAVCRRRLRRIRGALDRRPGRRRHRRARRPRPPRSTTTWRSPPASLAASWPTTRSSRPQVRRRLHHPRRGDLPHPGRRISAGGRGRGRRRDRTCRGRRHRRDYRRLDIPGIDRLEGSSVYYAATEFEARLCRQDPVTVVGGGNPAGQAACFLARQSRMVNLVIRHDDLGKTSRYLADRVATITIWRNREVCASGTNCSTRCCCTPPHRSEAAGRDDSPVRADRCGPHTSWLQAEIPLDAKGFVLTGAAADHQDGMFQIRRHGVFAVRGRTQWLSQTRRLRGRRGLDRDPPNPRLPADPGRQ